MNALELQLDYPHGDALPAPGHTLEVAPGVRWLRMTLPFQLNHVNLWLLRDSEPGANPGDAPLQGWTVIDCGISNAVTRAAWEAIFANELDGLPILRVIVTHMHPDHIGLAHWLTQRWSTPTRECRMWISAADYQTARLASASVNGMGGESTARFMASHGLVDAQAQAELKARTHYYIDMVPALPESYRRLVAGDTLTIGGRAWTCHVGYGHAPEHMALYCAQLATLISGDMVLPRISTNVSVHEDEPEANPLRRYLDSILRLKALPAPTRVLPSHGRPFTGLHTRIDQLVTHHDERFADVLSACAHSPQHAQGLLMVLFRRQLDLHQTTFAMGESIAHLNALWLADKLTRRLDGDGIYRFSTAD